MNNGRLVFLATTAFTACLFGPPPGFAKDAVIAQNDFVYLPRNGDNLSVLNAQYFIGADAIAQVRKLNRIGNPNLIRAGAPLRIPRALLRDELTYAKVESFSGPVTIAIGNAPVVMKLGTPISENADIRTGRNAFVTLRLSDGTALAVPSQSEVRIARMRRILLTGTIERDLDILSGRVHAQVTPMIDPNSTFRVITPLTVSAVRGTDFAIAYTAGLTRSATTVQEGVVAVNRPASAIAAGTGAGTGTGTGTVGAPDDLTLLPGFGAASGVADTTGIIKLLPEPGLVDPGAVQTGEQLLFTLKPVPGATAYRVQVSKDAGGLDIIVEDTSPTVNFALPSVPGGAYFMHGFAIDGNGLEGAPGTYNFQRVRNSVSAAMSQSAAGGIVKFLFKWAITSDAKPAIRFRMVRKLPAPAAGGPAGPAPIVVPIIDEPDLKSNSLEIGNLPNGDYSWQVSSTLVAGGKLVETSSPAQTFHIVGKH